MPTSTKPRHKKALQSNQPAKGQIWVELDEIYQSCLSKMHSTASVGSIMRDPTFASNAVNCSRMAYLAKTLGDQLPPLKNKVDSIRNAAKQLQAQWDALNQQKATYWKNGEEEKAHTLRDTMDNVEFSALQIGEAYQSWLSEWASDVTPGFIELMGLLEQTRDKMEKAANVNH